MKSFSRLLGAWVAGSLIVMGSAALAQDPFDQFDRPSFDDVTGLAPPPPPPPPPVVIRDFEIHYRDVTKAPEESITLRWTAAHTRSDYRIFRQRLQLAQRVDATGFMAFTLPDVDLVAPGGWIEIATVDSERNWFRDDDIPQVDLSLPPVERRSLGEVYCYRVEVQVGRHGVGPGVRKAISPAICTRLRGLNGPTLRFGDIGSRKVTLFWENNSQMRVEGYEVEHWREAGGPVQSAILVGAGSLRHSVTGLAPETSYCFRVWTLDYHGRSQLPRSFCTLTDAAPEPQPEPEPEPEERTFTVPLTRQIVDSGFPPYLGRFPTAGLLPKGRLISIELLSVWPPIGFVKPGHNTTECGDPNALVMLSPGQTLSPQGMVDAFGAATPNLPVLFVACVFSTGPLLNWVPIKITYIKD